MSCQRDKRKRTDLKIKCGDDILHLTLIPHVLINWVLKGSCLFIKMLTSLSFFLLETDWGWRCVLVPSHAWMRRNHQTYLNFNFTLESVLKHLKRREKWTFYSGVTQTQTLYYILLMLFLQFEGFLALGITVSSWIFRINPHTNVESIQIKKPEQWARSQDYYIVSDTGSQLMTMQHCRR